MDYYTILEINKDASDEVIKAAYRALVKKYHPDTLGEENSEAYIRMQKINEAYSVLSNSEKRKAYDLKMSCFHNENKSADKTDVEHKEEAGNQDKVQHTEGKESKFGKIFRAIGREIINDLESKALDKEKAYLNGIKMDNYSLVRSYKRAQGMKRLGYAMALEEKGLFIRDYDGKYIVTEEFKRLY